MFAGTLSVTSTENCALSAITKKPQTSATGTSSHNERPKAKPISTEQAPLMAMARVTSQARPRRSATSPPQMHPAPPIARAAKAMADAIDTPRAPAVGLCVAMLAAMNTGNHVHAA